MFNFRKQMSDVLLVNFAHILKWTVRNSVGSFRAVLINDWCLIELLVIYSNTSKKLNCVKNKWLIVNRIILMR